MKPQAWRLAERRCGGAKTLTLGGVARACRSTSPRAASQPERHLYGQRPSLSRTCAAKRYRLNWLCGGGGGGGGGRLNLLSLPASLSCGLE